MLNRDVRAGCAPRLSTLGSLEPPRAQRPDLRNSRLGPFGPGSGPQVPGIPYARRRSSSGHVTSHVDEVFTHDRLHQFPRPVGLRGCHRTADRRDNRDAWRGRVPCDEAHGVLRLFLPRRYRRRRGAAAGAARGLDAFPAPALTRTAPSTTPGQPILERAEYLHHAPRRCVDTVSLANAGSTFLPRTWSAT